MKRLLLIFIFLILLININYSHAQTCSGTSTCTGLTTPSSCNARCGCQWSAGVCNQRACSFCTTQSACTSSGCTWTAAPPAPTTATPTTTTEGGPTPIKLVFENPKDGETIKRGSNNIIVQGYKGPFLGSGISINVESVLFGMIDLENNFNGREDGIYGKNITIGKNTIKGQYAITAKGSSGTYDEQRILINVDPTIYINTSLKKKYSKGERINFEGILTYFDKSPLKNNSMRIEVISNEVIFNKTIKTNIKGIFSDSYLISFAEPDGEWKIKIAAEDKSTNEGSITFKTNVSTPKGVAFYTVNFLSPFEATEFKRGETIPITIEVKDEGKQLQNASVDFRTPGGDAVILQEMSPGTYISEYKIKPNDPLGKWNIAVQAVKTIGKVTKAGGTRIPITIRSSDLNIVLTSPGITNFFTGLKTEITAELSYPDGTKIEKANVFAVIGNETVKLTEDTLGIYSTPYLFTEKTIDANSLKIEASDSYGNNAVIERIIIVEKIGKFEMQVRLFYYNILAKYWYVFVLAILIAVLVTKPIWHKKYLLSRQNRLAENKKRSLEMEKDIQRKYFKQHSFSREDYDKLMLKYRENISTIEEKQMKIQKGLSKYHKKETKNKK